MASSALVYNGSVIQERGEMLSLTDMWRAAGKVPNKDPSQWKRKEGSEFIRHFETTMPVGQSGTKSECFQAVNEGGTWNTWAHWQIGMAYAKYLSPAFHAWCNEVVRAHMEGEAPAATKPSFRFIDDAPTFSEVFNEMFDKYLALGVDDVKAAFMAGEVASHRALGSQPNGRSASNVVDFRRPMGDTVHVEYDNDDAVVNNTELAHRLGIKANDKAGTRRSIPYLLVAAGLVDGARDGKLTDAGRRFARKVNGKRRWLSPQTAEYLYGWMVDNDWT